MKSGLQILVIDDDALVRKSIKILLVHAGHDVTAVEDGQSALSLLAQKPFDVVITDYSMPDMRGDQLVESVRRILPTQRIVMATAFVEEYETLSDPAAAGPFTFVDALLLKPFSFQELNDVIAAVTAPGGAAGQPPGAKAPIRLGTK